MLPTFKKMLKNFLEEGGDEEKKVKTSLTGLKV
jgi:hypothetical protein